MRSNMNAPYGRCPNCGWEGRDWGFKYRNLCKRCHANWRRKTARERRLGRTPTENIRVAEGIVVTEYVQRRLERRAECGVWPVSFMAGRVITPIIAILGAMYLIDLEKSGLDRNSVETGILLAGLLAAFAGYVVFTMGWAGIVVSRTARLARQRKQNLEGQRLFYSSPEWRLLRAEVIEEQGRRCRKCGRHIAWDFDLTVDHIKPISKFPNLGLDKSNLQVLCRQCNSSKRDAILDGVSETEGLSDVGQVKDGGDQR